MECGEGMPNAPETFALVNVVQVSYGWLHSLEQKAIQDTTCQA